MYYTAIGIRLYNPRSVVLALTDDQLRMHRCKIEVLDDKQ